MIKAIIIDDEQHCIDRLELLLKNNFSQQVELIGSFSNVDDGLKAIKDNVPDLLFLDVEINDKTGFDLLKQIPFINFEVIFTTAHDKYAVQAFKFSAIDYLLKPVDVDDLQSAIKKLNEKVSQKDLAQKFDTLFHNLKHINNHDKRICVPHTSGLMFLHVNDILRCESDVNYTKIFLKDKQKLTVAKTLKEFEGLLSDYNFYRVHNSHLINLGYIKNYHKGKGLVLMDDGSEIEVSTRRRDDFMKQLTTL